MAVERSSVDGVERPLPAEWSQRQRRMLLLLATLVTAVTYQAGTNIPDGVWDESQSKDGKLLHRAGDPREPRYSLFVAAIRVGFGSSMVMTLSLLLRMPADSRQVWLSLSVAYLSLLLAFVVSQPRTNLSPDILISTAFGASAWVIVSLKSELRVRATQLLCCSARNKWACMVAALANTPDPEASSPSVRFGTREAAMRAWCPRLRYFTK